VSRLQAVAENLWTVSVHHPFMGLHVGTRMTVVRLHTGGVLLYSPVPLDAALRAEIDAIGPVMHIVCPNVFHHMYAGEAVAAYPQALLHAPAELRKKRKDLPIAAELSETPHPDWQGDLQSFALRGSLMHETVFYHPASRTLITSDLVENFKTMPHLPTRIWFWLGGILGRVGWHRALRLVYVNRRAARVSVEQILGLPFERVIVAHGDIIEHDAKETLREGLRWL
jgi:hypothetical protein